ncbi:MAG: hypothetical protein ABSB74_17950 [Tepidisphaeraceae bacterium]
MRRGLFLRWMIALPALVFIWAYVGGCSTDQGTLRLSSMDGQHEFSQSFTQAYIARNQAGDADVVLVQDEIQPRHPDPTKPLVQDRCRMPRQLVHIRVFWMPMSGVKPDHPANTNASIHWCLVCNDSDAPGVVEYRGSGLVEVDDSSDGATVTIRKAWMKVGRQHGQLVDPLGPSILEGSFHALGDAGQVKSVIAEIKAAGASDQVQASFVPAEQPKDLAANPAN